MALEKDNTPVKGTKTVLWTTQQEWLGFFGPPRVTKLNCSACISLGTAVDREQFSRDPKTYLFAGHTKR